MTLRNAHSRLHETAQLTCGPDKTTGLKRLRNYTDPIFNNELHLHKNYVPTKRQVFDHRV